MKPLYGNWISNRMLKTLMFLIILTGGIETILLISQSRWTMLNLILALVLIVFLVCLIYFYRARWWFDVNGGNIQNKILDLLISHIEWDGNGVALDIGCGSGALTIEIAKRYPAANIIGIDNWGKKWDYTKRQCEANAQAEGVIGRTTFQQASDSKLPFPDETFDLVVSNLTFHEVIDSKCKLDVVKEALRVVKRGGKFVFQDLFLIKQYYGTPCQLKEAVVAMGINTVEFVNTCASPWIPKALRLPFMVGTLGLIHGEK
ncbi:MAG: class I SAM-dependent methyltransferase [Sphaerochaetaceae bacterium]